MSDVPLTGRPFSTRPAKERLDRAFVAAYGVALVGSLSVSFLTYAYVATGGVHEANPVVAALISVAGLEAMVVVRTIALIGTYWCYAVVRARTKWSTSVIAFAWAGAVLQLLNLAADLRVAAMVGPPATGAIVGGLAVVAPALVAGIVFDPPVEGT